MPHERVTSNRERRTQKVRSVAIAQSDTAVLTGGLLRNENLPDHLEPLKEHYEVTIFADELQNQVRGKAQRTITEMTMVTHDAVLTVNDKLVDSVNIVNETPMRPAQRESVTEVLDEVATIGHAALLDGLEESARIINEIADKNPTHLQRRKKRVRFDLTTVERVIGKAERDI